MNVQIRAAGPGDAGHIVEFNRALARETEHFELNTALVRAGVAAVLADDRRGRYLLACEGDRILAQLLVTTEWSDWRNAEFWWIQSVYVLPEARGQGLFSRLYRHLEQLARDQPAVCGLRLYVERDNASAARLYCRLGMDGEHYRMMETDFTRDG